MIRKEFLADQQQRQKRANSSNNAPASTTTTFVGNQRQMLQEIRESLSHLKKSEHSVNASKESMHIKSETLPLSNHSGAVASSSGKNARSTGYRQKALAQIRNSLLPYAAGSGGNELVGNGAPFSVSTSAASSSHVQSSGTSNYNSSAQSNGGQEPYVSDNQLLQQLLQLGYDEETILSMYKLSGGQSIRFTHDILVKNNETSSSKSEPINGLGNSGLQGIKGVIRKPSFEGRGNSPGGFIDSTASTRSDSPSLHPRNMLTDQSPPPRLTNAQSDNVMYVAGRQYAVPAVLPTEAPPPLPPPRHTVNGPPPTPPRGTTPPPPPLPPMPQPENRSQQQYGLASSQMQMRRRISPVSPARPQQVLSGHSTAASQSSGSASVRGTSPISFNGRAPMIVQNTPQAQQQLQQQLQALNIFHTNSSIPAHQMEPPPPYPIGLAAQNPVSLPSKLSAPYSSSSSNLSRQSPTPPSSEVSFGSSSVGSMQGKRQPPPPYQLHVAISLQQQQQMSSASSAVTPPVISTVSSRPTTLQAHSARQTKTQPPIIMQSVKSTQVQKPVLQTAIAPMSPPVNSSNNNSPSPPSYCTPYPHRAEVPAQTSVPTTDPPSYASSVQALAAQRAGVNLTSTVHSRSNYPTGYNVAQQTPNNSSSPTSSVASTVVKASTPTPSETPSSVDSISTSQTTSTSSLPSSTRTNQHTSLHRKFSPMAVDTASIMSRSESPVSFMSNITSASSPPSTQSDSTQDSGIGRGNGPSSQDPSYKGTKVTHQSPIPQRKAQSREKDEERREAKVRNYSPAAYKFFMEQHFENLLKSQKERELRRRQLEGEMAKVELSEDARHQMRLMLHQKESNYIRLKRAKMDKSMFKKIKTIGVGAFGEVALVCKINTTQYYAMKTLRKSDVLKRNQVAHVKAERDILAEADNEWVVKLYYSFQDKDNLYFVMDYIPGGDLMSLLIKFGIFKEPLAKFYIAELVLAIESVHKMGFIHRDIKPDNILIDKDGHIKLTDFGLCTGFRWTHNSKYYQNGEHQRQDSMDLEENWLNECRCMSHGLKPLERRRRREHQRCLAHSLVGTPNYIAPEVLMRTGYTQLCDWWSVGVILYEMLVGQPPFLASTPAETQFKVINWETTLKIPKQENLSQDAKALIVELCCGPAKRLGRGGAEEVKGHQFFMSIDFEKGLRRQQAPYIPKIRCPTDTSNFDPIDPERLHNSSSSGDSNENANHWFDMGNKQENEHGFFEFTFRRFFDDGGHAYSHRMHLDDNETHSGPDPVYV